MRSLVTGTWAARCAATTLVLAGTHVQASGLFLDSAVAGIGVPVVVNRYSFSNFTLQPLQTGAVQIAPSTIDLSPVFDPVNPGIRFILTTPGAGPDVLAQSTFSFSVTGPAFNSATLQLDMPSADSIATGVATLNGINIIAENLSPQLVATGTFAPVTTTTVLLDVTFEGATGSSLRSFVFTVPEPASLTLMALAAGVLLRRRK